MIQMTRFDQKIVYINPEIIESLESVPDTLITFINGKKLLVKENIEQIKEQFITYQRIIRQPFIQ